MNFQDVMTAVSILEPLIVELIKYLQGGAKPEWFDRLPATSRARVQYEAMLRTKS